MAVQVVRMISGLSKEHQQQTTIGKPSLVYQEASVMIGYFELVVIIVSLRKCNIEYGVDLFIYECFQLTAECDQQKYDTLPLEQLTVTRQNWWRYGRAYCCNIDLFVLGCDSIIADNTINFSLHAFTYFNFSESLVNQLLQLSAEHEGWWIGHNCTNWIFVFAGMMWFL